MRSFGVTTYCTSVLQRGLLEINEKAATTSRTLKNKHGAAFIPDNNVRHRGPSYIKEMNHWSRALEVLELLHYPLHNQPLSGLALFLLQWKDYRESQEGFVYQK